jgi:hypothetical protein
MQAKDGWALTGFNTALLHDMDFGLILTKKPAYMRISGVLLAALSLMYTTC